jgi:rod shape-determining protein MreB and related proteins
MTSFLSARFSSGSADLAIDLGTANTIVVERGSGVIFNQPSVCCFADAGAGARLFAAGADAHAMIGRVARPLRIARPLRNGVLSDMAAGRELLRHAVRRTGGAWRARRARALIGVPADATQAEQRALLTAAEDAGLGQVRLLPEPLMAAIGAGLDVDVPRGRMVIDCGAGTTEVVVISMGSICLSATVRIGGDTLDEALLDHLHLRHRFQIGVATAERLKLELAELLDAGDATDRVLHMKGQNPAVGRPETLSLPAAELVRVYERHLQNVVDIVRSALHRTPPELSQDIHDDGILLTGGASMAGLLSQRIGEATGLATRIAAAPLDCVALGLSRTLEDGQARAAA